MIEKRRAFIINVVYLLLIAVLSYGVLRFAFSYLMPFIIGFLIAWLLKPIIRFLKEKIGSYRWISGIVIFVFYIIVAIVMFWLVLGLLSGVKQIATKLPYIYSDVIEPSGNRLFNYLSSVVSNMDPRFSEVLSQFQESLSSSVYSFVTNLSKIVLDFATKAATSFPSFLIAFLTAIIASVFFVLDYNMIVSNFLGFLPQDKARLILDVKDHLTMSVGKYLRAYAILMTLTFIELSIGLSFLGISNAIGIAALVALVDVMPVLGTGTVMIPWVIIEFSMGNSSRAIGLLVIYIFITIVRNVLEPKIVGDQIGLHPLVTLMCIFVGVKLFSFIGLLGLPIVATIIKSLYDDNKISLDFWAKE